jgi:hypothetical protein
LLFGGLAGFAAGGVRTGPAGAAVAWAGTGAGRGVSFANAPSAVKLPPAAAAATAIPIVKARTDVMRMVRLLRGMWRG